MLCLLMSIFFRITFQQENFWFKPSMGVPSIIILHVPVISFEQKLFLIIRKKVLQF